MPASWTPKQERQYRHIYESCRAGSSQHKGKSDKTCKRIAAATVNKGKSKRKLAGCGCKEQP